MSVKSFYLTLVRHGETEANKCRIIQGQMDVPLSDQGRAQAAALCHKWTLNKRTFDLVYSSDLSRAFETAVIATGQKVDIVADDRLRERSYGDKQGIPLADLRAAAKEAGYNEKNYSSYTPAGAESLMQVRDRIRLFCTNHLVNVVDSGHKVLLVTHGGVIREFFRFFRDQFRCQLPTESEPYRVTPNTGVSTFRISFRPGQLVAAECIKVHDISHLTEAGLTAAPIVEVKVGANNDNLNICPPLEAL